METVSLPKHILQNQQRRRCYCCPGMNSSGKILHKSFGCLPYTSQCAMQPVALNTNFVFLLSKKECHEGAMVVCQSHFNQQITGITLTHHLLIIYMLVPSVVQFDLVIWEFISGEIPNKSQGWVFSHVSAGCTSCLNWSCSFQAVNVSKLFYYSFYCFSLLNLIQPQNLFQLLTPFDVYINLLTFIHHWE